MASDDNLTDTRLELVFEGRQAEHHRVPAKVLMDALAGLQRAIHLLAMDRERVEVRERDKVSSGIEQKYPLVVEAPRPNCLLVPAQIGDPASELFASQDIADVVGRLRGCLGAVASGNREAMIAQVPDRVRRERVLTALRSALPRKGSGIDLTIRMAGEPTPFRSEVLHEAFPKMLVAGRAEATLQTLTGRLSRIDFAKHVLTILYPVTNRELNCFYEESVEELLLENPRELIQVTGQVVLGEDDQPKEIVEVRDIREVDLSPIELREFRIPAGLLRFRKPRWAEVALDESQQLLMLRSKDIGLDLHATTRDALLEVLPEHLSVLFQQFTSAPDDRLTMPARTLKAALLDSIEIVASPPEGRADGEA